ncbi:MAG: DUF3395 domain-containing protein [Acidobacteria bacterium]|nr:DUF3395 domain-containing protein [Acidobacteriota bacterium]
MASSLAFGQNFRVLKAEYGANNTWLDVTQKLSDMVRGNGFELRVDAETLSDPLPGVEKTLRIRYFFRNRTQTENFKDLETVRLGSLAGGPVVVAAPVAVGTGVGGTVSVGNLRVLLAQYGADRRFRDVTQTLNSMIQGGRLRVQVTNENFGGDPAPANKKALRVDYEYQGVRNTVTVAEAAFLELPTAGTVGVVPPQPGNLRILSATFGNGSNNQDVTAAVAAKVNGDMLDMVVSTRELGLGNVLGLNTLTVMYEMNGRRYESRVRQNGRVQLPNDNDPPVGGAVPGSEGGSSIFGPIGGQLIIENAIWGTTARNMDVTDVVRGAMRNGRLSVRADINTMQCDPALNLQKQLVIRYKIGNGAVQTQTTREGGTANLP